MARSDTRDNLTVSNRPFARVLTQYMWSKQPPWSPTRLARELGLGRARVVNWIYHNTDPDLATMLAVMAQLNIPTTALLRAYEQAGLPTPPLTGADEPALQPAPSEPAPALDPEAQAEAEWQTMLDHTRQVMRMTGMSDEAINGMLANLSRDRAANRAGQPSPRDRRLAEELRDEPPAQGQPGRAPTSQSRHS